MKHLLKKLAEPLTEKEKRYIVRSGLAPGLPKRRTTLPPKITRPQVWEFSAHPHHAIRAGKHIDLRLGDRGTGIAHSFVLPKRTELPAPGEAARVIPTYDHTLPYMDFTGRISTPYGRGEVKPGRRTQTEVYHSEPDDEPGTKLRFNLYDEAAPEEFSIRKDKSGKWFLHNKTQTRDKRPDLPASKPKYKEVQTDKVDFADDQQAMMPKLDGAHAVIDLKAGRAPRVYSYREGKKAKTGLIEHTHKMGDLLKTKVPKELDGTLLRAEVLGVKDGKAIPAQKIGGLLNSKVWESRKKQSAEGVKLKAFPFSVVRHKGKDLEDAPFTAKKEILDQVAKALPELELPEMATTSQEKMTLLNRIRAKQHPLTEEGVVLVNKDRGGAPIKAKFAPDFDVHVRKVNPAISGDTGKAHDRAGSISYSWTPDGPIMGTLGGFKHDEAKDMMKNPDRYVGRVAKVKAMKAFKGKDNQPGALFQPRFKEWHLDKGEIEKSAANLRRKVDVFLLDKKNRVLAEQHSGGSLKFPGGGIDPGESVNAAAKREVLEEVGYKIDKPFAVTKPVSIQWGSELTGHLGAKGKARAKQFVGERRFFRAGQVVGKDTSVLGADQDTMKNTKFIPIPKAMKMLQQSAQDPDNPFAKYDVPKIKALEQLQKRLEKNAAFLEEIEKIALDRDDLRMVKMDVKASLKGLATSGSIFGAEEQKGPPEEAVQSAKAVASTLKGLGVDPKKARIAVAGGGGTGKSTLARLLSDELGMKSVPLDKTNRIGWTDTDIKSYVDKKGIEPGSINEQSFLLNQVDPDKFDVIMRVHQDPAKTKQQLMKRERGAGQWALFDYPKVHKAVGTAFHMTKGKTHRPAENVELKLKPKGGFQADTMLDRKLTNLGIDPSGMNRNRKVMSVVEGRKTHRPGMLGVLKTAAKNLRPKVDVFVHDKGRVLSQKHAQVDGLLSEIEKIGYDAGSHKALFGHTAESMGMSPAMSQLGERGALGADKGIRHPHLPGTSDIHSLPGVTKKQIGQDILKSRNRAIQQAAKAMAGNNPTALSAAMMNLGESQHTLADLSAHYEKPLEQGVTTKKTRGLMRFMPGKRKILGGAEHFRTGRSGQGAIGYNLDVLDPTQSEIDRRAIKRSQGFGRAARRAMVRELQQAHGLSAAAAESTVKHFLEGQAPGRAAQRGGQLARNVGHVGRMAARKLLRLG